MLDGEQTYGNRFKYSFLFIVYNYYAKINSSTPLCDIVSKLDYRF